MNSIEEKVSRFRVMADVLLKEQVAELNRLKENNLLSGKLARITTFNSQLEHFKGKLNESLEVISRESRTDVGHTKLKSSMMAVYNEYVSEFMCLSFEKDSN